jgi:hypothetical protein
MVAELFHNDIRAGSQKVAQKDGHDESIIRFSQLLCESVLSIIFE